MIPPKIAYVPLTESHVLISDLTDCVIHVPALPSQVRRAREQVRGKLLDWALADHADDVILLVSELVTNAIRHGTGPVELSMIYRGGQLRCEVRDNGAGSPQLRPATADDTSGRGLELVDRLTAELGGDWGIIPGDGHTGKRVYVTVPAGHWLP